VTSRFLRTGKAGASFPLTAGGSRRAKRSWRQPELPRSRRAAIRLTSRSSLSSLLENRSWNRPGLGARLAAVSYEERPSALCGLVDKGGCRGARGVERGLVRAEKEGPLSHASRTRRVKAEPSGAAYLCLSPIGAARDAQTREPTIVSGGCENAVLETWRRLGGATKPEKLSLAEERRLTGDEDRG
jgi:hypothetical protein